MRKFTLILTALLLALTVEAKQKVIYLDSFDIFWGGSDTYKITEQQLEIGAAAFSNLSEGDYLQIDGLPIKKLTQKSDDQEVDNYTYQMQLCGFDKTSGDWKTFVAGFSVDANPISIALTTSMVEDIKAKGLVIQGYGFTVKRVAIGSSPTYNAATDVTCETDYPFVLATDWSTVKNITTDISSLKVGDKITVAFTCGDYTEDWQCQVQLADNDDWAALFGANLGGKTSYDFYMTESVIQRIQAGHGLAVKGTNITITGISLSTRSSALTYSLAAGLPFVLNLADIPSSSDIELIRKFDWQTTICLPFDVDDLSVFGHSAKAYEFKEYTAADGLKFTERSKIKAGVPYLMTFDMSGMDEAEKTYAVTFNNVTVNTTITNSAESGGLTFKGNYTPNFNMLGKYGVACVQHGGNWDWGFYKGGTGSKLNAFSSYIEGTPATSQLAINLDDDETTGLKSIDNGQWTIDNYYDLQGRRITNPTKGLYIVNGKKVIIK